MKKGTDKAKKLYRVVNPEDHREDLTTIFATSMEEAYEIWGDIWQDYAASPIDADIIEAGENDTPIQE